MDVNHRERRVGVRRTRRKGIILFFLLGTVVITYLWQVSRKNIEAAVYVKNSSPETQNLRFVVETSNKNQSRQSEYLSQTVTMTASKSSIKETPHLIKVDQLISSPEVSPVKLSLREKVQPKLAVEPEINERRVSEELHGNVTDDINLNHNVSDRLPLGSKEEIQQKETTQEDVRRENASLMMQQAKKQQLEKVISTPGSRSAGTFPQKGSLQSVQNKYRAKIEIYNNQSQDTDLMRDNKDSVALSMIIEGYKNNYTQPRYSFSPEGQFQLMKFVSGTNLSRNDAFENSPFNARDRTQLKLLSNGEIREIYSIAHHPRLRLVAFDGPTLFPNVVPIESCPVCGTIKSPDDINEVFAFHVDRVLGINRTLPVTARELQDIERENLDLAEDLEDYEDKIVPVMWFAKNLTHGGKFQTDQNSFQLNWRQYQEILSGCYEKPNLTSAINCTEIDYSEWSRMAVFDFIMQNHDRLDRYCCGYDVDEGENCFQSEVKYEIKGCDDVEHRYLVHILTVESNPHQLVLLDNAGNLHRSKDHLNYEILKGIRSIPKAIMEKIYSDDLEDRILGSLKWDLVYWKSLGEDTIKEQVHTIFERLDALRAFINTSGIVAF